MAVKIQHDVSLGPPIVELRDKQNRNLHLRLKDSC